MPKKNKNRKRNRKLFRQPIPPTMESDLMNPDKSSPSNPPYPGGISEFPEATVAWCQRSCRFAQVNPFPLSLELLCGASDVDSLHQGYFDPTVNEVHPGQLKVKQLAEPLGMTVDVSPSLQDNVWYSDAYVRFNPEQIDQLVSILRQADHPGDILDIYGQLTPEQEKHVLNVAQQQGWRIERH